MRRSEIAIYSETVPVSNEFGRIIQAFMSLAMTNPTNHTVEILTNRGVPILASVSVSVPIPMVSVSDQYR